MLYGRLPTRRMPDGKRAKSYSSASAQCTVSWDGVKRAASAAARSRSTSIASSLPARSMSGVVSAPSPGPISTRKSCGDGATASTMRANTRGSCRKCWPKRLRGLCELDGKLDRLGEAAGIGAPGSGQVERGAVIDRCADERQAERDVHAAAEARVLQHRQSLVVVHGEHRICRAQPLRYEERVGGNRPPGIDALAHRLGDGGRDHLDVLAAKMARFAAMGIEAGDQDAGLGKAKAALEVGVEHAQRGENAVAGNGARHIGQRQMGRSERDA